MSTFEHIKEEKAIAIRFQRMVRELESKTSSNSHTCNFRWRYEIDRDLNDPMIIADYRIGDDFFIQNAITLGNPTIKHLAKHNNITYWEVIKDWTNWTHIIQYFKINYYIKPGKTEHITHIDVKDMIGVDPIDTVLLHKRYSDLHVEEYEWMLWIGKDRSLAPEWRDDWYIFDLIYLPLIGQLFNAYLR